MEMTITRHLPALPCVAQAVRVINALPAGVANSVANVQESVLVANLFRDRADGSDVLGWRTIINATPELLPSDISFVEWSGGEIVRAERVCYATVVEMTIPATSLTGSYRVWYAVLSQEG